MALAALLARQPQLWLLDEPHAGLDAEHRELLDGLLKEVTAARGDCRRCLPRRAYQRGLADRVVTMSGGTVLDGILTSPVEGVRDVAGGQALRETGGPAPEEVPSAV